MVEGKEGGEDGDGGAEDAEGKGEASVTNEHAEDVATRHGCEGALGGLVLPVEHAAGLHKVPEDGAGEVRLVRAQEGGGPEEGVEVPGVVVPNDVDDPRAVVVVPGNVALENATVLGPRHANVTARVAVLGFAAVQHAVRGVQLRKGRDVRLGDAARVGRGSSDKRREGRNDGGQVEVQVNIGHCGGGCNEGKDVTDKDGVAAEDECPVQKGHEGIARFKAERSEASKGRRARKWWQVRRDGREARTQCTDCSGNASRLYHWRVVRAKYNEADADDAAYFCSQPENVLAELIEEKKHELFL
mmetsp:Transcript_14475/g.45498  ORF Transcript_14475/g.45498 Transcript_14475/m.45498 type:complete len:301 (+) Transcript_14475:247-1149(+)